MKPLIKDESISLIARQDWVYILTDKIECDKLFYAVHFNEMNKNKTVFTELLGEGLSKLIRIDFNTNKGFKTGEFNTQTTFTNIFFNVEKIRIYSEIDIEFVLSVYENKILSKVVK